MSDPIEVLRELAAMFESLEADYRAKIKGRDAADPMTNFNLGIAEGYERASKAAQAALVSLSAPKPPSMNDNAVAVNESAPVNDKPESAEAVGEVLRSEDGVARVAMFDDSLRPGTKVYTAPPRPEASAPVGVEAIIEAFDEITGLCRHLRQGGPAPEDLHDLSGALDEAIGIAGNMLAALAQQPSTESRCDHCGGFGDVTGEYPGVACPKCRGTGLAQQPAAVDEAVGTVTRVGSFEVQEHRIELDPEFDERLNNMPEGAVVRLYAAPVRDLTQQQLAAAFAALAGQQQGGPQE